MKTTKFYVYHDGHADDIEIFKTLKEAKAWAEVNWPPCCKEDIWDNSHEKWFWGEYVTIYEKTVK